MNALQKPSRQPLLKRLFSGPATKAGRAAVALLVVHLVFLLLWQSHLVDRLYRHAGDGFFSNPLHAGIILLAVAAAIGAGLVSIFAMAWRRERSLVLTLITLYALFVAAFALGEVLSPH